jgi:hypothetical protein
MSRKLLVLATAAIVALCFAFVTSGSQAATADQVTLTVYARSIDGALLFSKADGWSWRCMASGNRECSVNTARGQVITVSAENGAASSFLTWDGACAGSGRQPTCTLQINDSVSVTARFSPLRLSYPVFGQGYVIVESRQGGRQCGPDCRDLAWGDTIIVRARARSGWQFTGWGPKCSSIRGDCRFTMLGNYTAAATFEPIPPPDDCPDDSSCGQVTPSLRFVVGVTGSGKVIAQAMVPYRSATECRGTGTCSIPRPEKKKPMLKAIPDPGARFLGWGGRCRYAGLSTDCTFYNGYGSDGAPRITAAFG